MLYRYTVTFYDPDIQYANCISVLILYICGILNLCCVARGAAGEEEAYFNCFFFLLLLFLSLKIYRTLHEMNALSTTCTCGWKQ